jgi:glutathione S-transferase
MQLVGMLDSPFVRRVAVALIVARVPFEHRPISLFRHMDAFSSLNPLLKAPTLVLDDGVALMDSSLILAELAALFPSVAALTPATRPARQRAARMTGVALAVMEKAVQRHYERALRPPGKSHAPWIERVTGQLHAGLAALDSEAPRADWVGGETLGLADIAAVCAFTFADKILAPEDADLSRYPALGDFAARAESLAAFRAAPHADGVTAPLAIAD